MSASPKQVLLIEDNPADADFIRLRLSESNSDLQVTCADRLATGLAALTLETPAVVLLDLNLPDSRGAETLRNVLQKAPGVPIVILSGQHDAELEASAVYQGVQEYLVKGSFNVSQLTHAMRYAIGRQALLTALETTGKQQLQYKNQFLSHVSHELRTPLTCAHQFLTIVLDGLAGPISSEQQDHLETALGSMNQLRTMIGGLLDSARAESGKVRIDPGCVAIGSVVRQAASMMQATAKTSQVSLEVSVDDTVLLAFADPHRILQVLTNLIDNATKFTLPGGSVKVKAGIFEPDPAFLCVSVADSGRGIRPEAKALIFDRLYQESNNIENNSKGLGLGLFIVRELVRLHGGQIWVESQVGYGSTFSFTLPVFSLSRLLFPVLTDRGHLPHSLSLVTVELSSEQCTAIADRRDRCLELLRSCILPTKDLVLPPMGTSSQEETFWIVASADQNGANILAQRIRDRLNRSGEAEAGTVFTVNVRVVPLSVPDIDEALESQVERVAEVLRTIVQADIERNHLPRRETQIHKPQLVVRPKRRNTENGQTENTDC